MTIRSLLPRTLKAQLLIYGAVAVLVAAAVTTFVNFRIAEVEARREVRAHMLEAGTALQSALEFVGPKEAQMILEAYHRVSEADEVHEALLVDPQGLIVAASRKESIGKPVEEALGHPEHGIWAVLAGRLPQAGEEMTHRGVPVLDFTIPIYGDPADPNRVTAALHYVESYTTYAALVQRALVEYLLAGLLMALFLIFPLWFYLERSLLRPLHTLNVANEAVAEGRSEGRMIPPGAMPSHELGGAMRSRNEMLIRLEAAQEELRRRLDELAALNAVAATANRSLKLDEVLNSALDKILEIMKVEAGEIFLLVEKDGELRMAAHRGLFPESFQQITRFKLGEGFPGRVAQTGEPLITTELANDLRYLRQRVIKAGFGSFACVPLRAKGKVVGTIDVSAQGRRPFSRQEIDLLANIGNQLGLAIENAWLYQAEQSQRQLAETLRDVSQTLTASLDLDEVLHTLLEQLGRVLVVDAGLILLREDDELRVAAVRGRPELRMEQLRGYRLPASANRDFWQVIQEKRVLTFCEPGRRPPFAEGFHPIEEVDWCLVVPLLRGNEVVGLLALEQLDHCYDEGEEPQIALAFANHAVAAIENARLYAETKTLNEELEARVEQRTGELNQARASLAQQADQLRHLLNKTIRIQEEERDRIAQDIHDGVSQLIMGALYEAQAAKVSLPERPAAAREKLQNAQEILKQVKTEMRRLIYDLDPEALTASGLVSALESYAGNYQDHTGIRCILATSGPVRRLAPERERAIYRIAQEALHNVAQHARADESRVTLAFTQNALHITVEDNGRGFDRQVVPNASPGRLGLVSMRERAQSIGGDLKIKSQPGSGTRVIVRVPIDGHTGGDEDG